MCILWEDRNKCLGEAIYDIFVFESDLFIFPGEFVGQSLEILNKPGP